jgi:hypothetical protein
MWWRIQQPNGHLSSYGFASLNHPIFRDFFRLGPCGKKVYNIDTGAYAGYLVFTK